MVKKASCTTTNGQVARASCTLFWSGSDCAGLVQAIHRALILPACTASNSSMAVNPLLSGSVSTPQYCATSARCKGSAASRWPGRRLDRLPVSRPPMAFGWPVREKGPAPGLPICPVARCRLISALFLALPLLDWLRPMHHSERKLGALPIICAQTCKVSWLMPHSSLTICGL